MPQFFVTIGTRHYGCQAVSQIITWHTKRDRTCCTCQDAIARSLQMFTQTTTTCWFSTPKAPSAGASMHHLPGPRASTRHIPCTEGRMRTGCWRMNWANCCWMWSSNLGRCCLFRWDFPMPPARLEQGMRFRCIWPWAYPRLTTTSAGVACVSPCCRIWAKHPAPKMACQTASGGDSFPLCPWGSWHSD